MQDIDEHPEPGRETNCKFPGTVVAAGIIWIVYGVVLLIDLLVLVLKEDGLRGLFGGLIGTFLVYEGIQTVRGKSPDTIANGIGSILLSVLFLGMGTQLTHFWEIVIAGVAGSLLLLAGLLFVTGRTGYLAWRRCQQTESPRVRCGVDKDEKPT